jgi:glycogen debranching enzyme
MTWGDNVGLAAGRRAVKLSQGRYAIALLSLALTGRSLAAEAPVTRFLAVPSGLHLEQPARAGRFFAIAGRRAAVFGMEGRSLEAWAYPLKLVDDFRLSFRLEGYPLDIDGSDTLAAVSVRPEATTFTYAHAAFTVRQTVLAPIDEPGVVMLLDIDSALPMTVTASFRPRLKLMWPAGLMTPNVEWDEKAHLYVVSEESKRFAGVVGSPGGVELALMPYQEEPKDVPLKLSIPVSLETMRTGLVPIVFAGSVRGRDDARATYARLLQSAPELYRTNLEYYRDLLAQTLSVETPDARLDAAFAWAKVGIDKGLATNPLLGTGLLAGFRTSGDSERPGFAWLFGRDALWTTLATTAYGERAVTRLALDFLRLYQRADGKIPHEISQSATLIPWFDGYEYPWNSADATPLFVIAQGDYYRASGDQAFLAASWPAILKAYRFTAGTDTDGNDLIENTKFGHGWVEGGALYPPHEEIYMQGLWVEASRAMAEMAAAMSDAPTAALATGWAEKTRAAMEKTYWLDGPGYYAFATAKPREKAPEAEPGPNRARRQARMEALAGGGLVNEDTVLPAVPLWWRTAEAARAQSELDHLGGAALATDWGSRLLSDGSALYDPLSYHYGSVWPLFTGWTAMAAYRYGRPSVGYQALMANALLTFPGAMGSVTELLSGDRNAVFGRSSHHQVWSQAMVVLPLLRGLFGVEANDAGRTLRVAPQLPPDWEHATLRHVAVGGSLCDIAFTRSPGRLEIALTRRSGEGAVHVVLSPAFPLDARVRAASHNGGPTPFQSTIVGDVQQVTTTADGDGPELRAVYEYDEGTEAFVPAETPAAGARSTGLRLLRSQADASALRLSLQGLAGRSYTLKVRSAKAPIPQAGITVAAAGPGFWDVGLAFEGAAGQYVARDLAIELRQP